MRILFVRKNKTKITLFNNLFCVIILRRWRSNTVKLQCLRPNAVSVLAKSDHVINTTHACDADTEVNNVWEWNRREEIVE